MPDAAPLVVALLGALAFGCGDYAGGRSAARLPTAMVIAISQVFSAVLAACVMLASSRSIGAEHLPLASLGGLAHAAGALVLYHGIAHGRIAIVAPVAAVSGLTLPLLGDMVVGALPPPVQIMGIASAALSVALLGSVAEAGDEGRRAFSSVTLGLFGGIAFGLADLSLGVMPEDAAVSALGVARITGGMAALAMIIAWLPRVGAAPVVRTGAGMAAGVGLAVLAGALDVLGQLGYVLAATRGQMSVAAAACNLYPAVTVGLGLWLLKERLCRRQVAGLASGGIGVMLMAA